MSVTFQTQIASIMEIMAKAVLTEIRKVVEGSATLNFEISHCRENEESTVKLPVVENEMRMTQLASLIEILAQETVNKICKLASEECAVLRLEASQSQSEIGALKRKLELKEQELRTAQGGGAGERPVNTQSVGVQVGCELREAVRVEAHSANVNLLEGANPTDVEDKVSPVQCVVMIPETADVEDRIESIIIKVEGLEEDSESRELEEGLDLTEEGCVSFGTDAAEKLPVVHQECVEECRIPAESAEGKLPPAESDSNIKDKNGKVRSVKRVKKANGAKTSQHGHSPVVRRSLFQCVQEPEEGWFTLWLREAHAEWWAWDSDFVDGNEAALQEQVLFTLLQSSPSSRCAGMLIIYGSRGARSSPVTGSGKRAEGNRGGAVGHGLCAGCRVQAGWPLAAPLSPVDTAKPLAPVVESWRRLLP
ncbi:hypothetical protein AGOR_G00122510 [Albula goreensis]|uniref:Uncharacterized protein n=1 Tax=Albula goreensis TaxID=1534307 RepID=A0A8T3DAW1_9TELE|nr:hypothetical protein AGOR_G00122510 [Albula goreensis]